MPPDAVSQATDCVSHLDIIPFASIPFVHPPNGYELPVLGSQARERPGIVLSHPASGARILIT